MEKLGIIAVGIALANTLAMGSMAPASANDLSDLLRGYLGVNPGSSGGFAKNQALIQNNINTGLPDMSTRISAGISSGQLTPDEAASLNMELDRIRNMHAQFMADGGYTNAELQSIHAAFTNFNTMLTASSTNANTIGIYQGGYPYTGYPNYTSFRYNFPTYESVTDLQARIISQINAGVANGTLTASEAAELRAEYNRISWQINRRSLRGNYNRQPVVQRLMSLDRRVARLTNDTHYAGARSRWWY